MSTRAGLFIGRSFLELTVKKETSVVSRRIAYSLNSLDSQLRSLISLVGGIENCDSIRVRTRMAWPAIEKRMGSSFAFITSNGLENWLDLNLPLTPDTWSLNLKRTPSPLSKDNIFGLTERTSPTGKIEIEPTETELEFLAAKLKLNEVKNIAIGLLHSAANGANEKKVADYFRAQGFHVYASCEISKDREERPRFWAAALTAYIDPFLKEKMELVLKVITDSQIQPEIVQYGPSSLLEFLSGSRHWLESGLQNIESKEPFLFCGIDDLELVGLESQPERTECAVGTVGLPSSLSSQLHPSLLSLLEVNFFGLLDWSLARLEIEPGPICLGRALKPALLDAIASEYDLSEIDGLKEKVSAKTLLKVSDAFKTYSRADSATHELIHAAALMWIQQLASLTKKPLILKGPMAPIIQKLLQNSDTQFLAPASLDYYMSESLA